MIRRCLPSSGFVLPDASLSAITEKKNRIFSQEDRRRQRQQLNMFNGN